MYYCADCPRKCNAPKSETQPNGYCGAALLPIINRAAPHYWEEPCISGEKGSGAVFFGGCVLKCVYCQNHKISRKPKGKAYSIDELAELFRELEQQGVHNINLVTPTHYTYAIIKAFEKYKPKIPIVYNCGGYESVETLKRLDGIVDIYMPDFKYYSGDTALRYSNAPDYVNVAKDAIAEMFSQVQKPIFDDDGIMQKGVIVRHLVLPSLANESKQIISYLDKTYGEDIIFSLMRQYYPACKLDKFPELMRKVTDAEYEEVSEHLFSSSLDGFVQDNESADASYTPEFYTE